LEVPNLFFVFFCGELTIIIWTDSNAHICGWAAWSTKIYAQNGGLMVMNPMVESKKSILNNTKAVLLKIAQFGK